MGKTQDRGRLDWLVELAGASAPAMAASFAAMKLAPFHGWPFSGAMLAGFGITFGLSFAAIRLVPAEQRLLPLPEFEPSLKLDEVLLPDDTLLLEDRLTDDELLLSEALVDSAGWPELLLDQALVAPTMASATAAVAELLLDDPLPVPAPDSRVVQLFADGRMPTAGQLQRRIDRHLADGARPTADPATSDALGEALAELRRSLRQA